jgi:hypothetical protein
LADDVPQRVVGRKAAPGKFLLTECVTQDESGSVWQLAPQSHGTLARLPVPRKNELPTLAAVTWRKYQRGQP